MKEYYKTELGTLFNGDCLEVMDTLIKEGIKVDAIITDPPYQTTACAWDTLIPFNKHIIATKGRSKKLIPMYEDEWVMRELEATDKSIHQCREEFEENSKEGMWDKLNKLIKPNGAIVLFGSEPFSSALRMSNIKNYKYDWIWEKEQGLGNLNAKKRPLIKTEQISIFYKKQPLYNPQMTEGKPYKIKRQKNTSEFLGANGTKDGYVTENKGERYPTNILFYKRPLKNRCHPTQKPVALMEYLIKTYTNENELILDFTSGSGTLAVACENTNRRWICIEKDEDDKGNILGYCDITVERLKGGVK